MRNAVGPKSRTRRTLGPINGTDGALICSFASLPLSPGATALLVNQVYVVAGGSAVCARRNWLRALHGFPGLPHLCLPADEGTAAEIGLALGPHFA